MLKKDKTHNEKIMLISLKSIPRKYIKLSWASRLYTFTGSQNNSQ